MVESNDIMDYTNERVKEIFTKFGHYKAPQALSDGVKVEEKGISSLDNSAKYLGQWSLSNNKHGTGIQVWSDGSMYEG